MARLEQANLDLRRRVAQVLREHEDDLAQFDELLQVAPANLFASFVAEANAALDKIGSLAAHAARHHDVDAGLRATHTLKATPRLGPSISSPAGPTRSRIPWPMPAERAAWPTPPS